MGGLDPDAPRRAHIEDCIQHVYQQLLSSVDSIIYFKSHYVN